MIRRAIRSALNVLRGPRRLEHLYPPLIERAAWFVACEMIEGDYIEFGVYEGASFHAAYDALERAFRRRIAQREGEAGEDQRARRTEIFRKMKFIALDSFAGLPPLVGPDQETEDFREGQYAVKRSDFLKRVRSFGIPERRVSVVPGWFSDTSNNTTWRNLGVNKAAIIWIDGDLYSSARDALAGVGDLLQDGTVIIFDDWFAFKGNPRRGEQRAFAEWRETIADFEFVEFHTEGVWRKSFIATEKDV